MVLAPTPIGDDDGQWMGPWGLLDRPPSGFISGRPLRILNVSTHMLRIPGSLLGHVYNPSIAPMPKRLQHEMGCVQCTHVLTARVDWVNACTNRTPGELFEAAKENHWAHRGLGRRKMTLVSIIKANWKIHAWGWLQLAPHAPAPQLGRIDEWKVMARSTSIVDARLVTPTMFEPFIGVSHMCQLYHGRVSHDPALPMVFFTCASSDIPSADLPCCGSSHMVTASG